MVIETKDITTASGVKIAYVKASEEGSTRPIILLHGNGQSGKIFKNAIAQFVKEGYVVYAPDSRSHGKSGRVKRLRYEDMAQDMMELITAEQMEKPVFFGFSDGGIVGLHIAMKNPNVLGQLIVAGINLTPQGITWRNLIRVAFFFTRSDKFRLMLTQPEITAEQLSTITAPTTIFYAQKDIVLFTESQTAAQAIPNSNLIELPGENHGSYVMDNVKLFHLLKGVINLDL
jgi:pimeloyl-ACP methyl ester carboxylesterase